MPHKNRTNSQTCPYRIKYCPDLNFVLFSYRRRMFLLTEGPHLYYVDASAMVLKGEIPWSATMKTELRDFRIFFVHVPGRIYYLIDNESTSKDWCAAIGKYAPLKICSVHLNTSCAISRIFCCKNKSKSL